MSTLSAELNILGNVFKDQWGLMEIGGTTVFSDHRAKCIKDYLRSKGIEPRKLPFEMSEDLVYVRKEDMPRAIAAIKVVRLRDICGSA